MAIGGTLSLGHAAFFGVGAYTTAILFIKFGVNPWVGILLSMVTSALTALLLVVPLLRLRGPFFTLSSLAFVEVLRLLAIWAVPVTNGSSGLTTPSDQGFAYISFENREPYYYIVLAFVIIVVAFSVWLYGSKVGYHLRALKTDEQALRALGVRTNGLKISIMVISAAITGAFGAFSAIYYFVIEPETQFSMMLYSVQPALNGIIGGMGTVVGPIIGAVLMTPPWRMAAHGLLGSPGRELHDLRSGAHRDCSSATGRSCRWLEPAVLEKANKQNQLRCGRDFRCERR